MRPPPVVRSGDRSLGGIGLLGLFGVGAAVGLGSLGVAEVLLIPTVLALGASLVSQPAPAPTGWSILSGPVARAQSARLSRVGVVRAARGVRLLRSPLRDVTCVAYRLSGSAAEMPIDDARGRPFDLELDDGDRVRIDARIATIDLPMPEGDPAVAPPAGRASFLAHRGVTAIESARVTEAVLVPGTRIIATGRLHEEAIASGYRATRVARTLIDAPGAPLLIRLVAEARRKNQESGDASA